LTTETRENSHALWLCSRGSLVAHSDTATPAILFFWLALIFRPPPTNGRGAGAKQTRLLASYRDCRSTCLSHHKDSFLALCCLCFDLAWVQVGLLSQVVESYGRMNNAVSTIQELRPIPLLVRIHVYSLKLVAYPLTHQGALRGHR